MTILDCSDLYSISLHGDDVQSFETRWDEALFSTLGILVKRCLNQKISARIGPEMKESGQEHQRKAKSVSDERTQGECYQ